jgi:hypothetical protein
MVSPLAAQPPDGLVRKIAEREAANEEARNNYLYQQSLVVEEMDSKGSRAGEYRERREVIFSASGERIERAVGTPTDHLKRLRLTDEDFEDIRHIQTLLLTPDVLPRYEAKFRGDEMVEGKWDCWVVELKPRQIFPGFRMFEGILWAEKKTLSVVKLEGRAVPPVYLRESENLFPRFTTLRAPVDGDHWFPALTSADDVLPFRNGPLRMKMTIRYESYKRFGAESQLTFETQK